jgi:CO dehydrogenase nickel-insertion accessory protein CooC1
MSRDELADDSKPPFTIAVVSGKGGSGKTMIATAMAQIFAEAGLPVVLVDADTGTAGMSYYLGLRQVRNIRAGLSALINRGSLTREDMDLVLQKVALMPGAHPAQFLPIGDHRRLSQAGREASDQGSGKISSLLRQVVQVLRERPSIVIVDCRGGVDDESLAVCDAADDIILVIEPDTTSFQASRHLVEVLSDAGLDDKLRGFIVNKAFEDPASVARNGTSMFGAQFLAGVPFDFEATRAFLVGDLPRPGSVFYTHVQEAVDRAYPNTVGRPLGRIWTAADYDVLSLPDPDTAAGGYIAAAISASAGITFIVSNLLGSPIRPLRIGEITILAFLGIMAGIEPLRRILGKLIRPFRLLAGGQRARSNYRG